MNIRRATPADTPQILALMTASLGEGPRTPAYWRWKHEANPFGTSPALLAFDGDRLVGSRVFMRWTWRADDRELRAARAVDTATHPDFQGKGIFKTLTLQLVEQMRDEGTAFIFNTPNDKSRPGYLKMGWSIVDRVTVWLRPGRAGAPSEDGSVADLLRALPAFDVGDRRLHTPRTPAYLRWRYADVPGLTYHATWDERAAVVYRRRTRRGLRELTVVEVLGPAAPLLRRLAGARVLTACAPLNSPEARELLLAGFVPVPKLGPHLTARVLHDVRPNPLRARSWRCSIGDLELF